MWNVRGLIKRTRDRERERVREIDRYIEGACLKMTNLRFLVKLGNYEVG